MEIQTTTVTISENTATVTNLGSNQWQATYTMQDGDEEGIISFQIDTLTDIRGNPTEGTSSTTDGTIVTFDNSQPTLNLVNIASNNADSSWAKVGDTVTVAFKGNELLIDQLVTIVTQTAAITSTGFANFYSLSFDGSNDYVQIPHQSSQAISQNITLASWITVDAFGNWDGVITKGINKSPYALQLWGNGSIRFSANWGSPAGYSGSGSWNSTGTVGTNSWHHIAVSYDGSNITFFIDGVLDSQVNNPGLVFGDDGEDLVLGADFPGGNEYFDGIMDDVSIWNLALSQSDIQANMNNALTGNENGLVGYWNFDEGTGTQVTDQTSNGNDGTIYGAVWTTDIPINAKKFYAKYVMTETDPEGAVPFEILVTDSVGLISDTITSTTDNSAVIFDRTAPTLPTVHIESDNGNNTLIAIAEDQILLSFIPDEPLIMDSITVTISDQVATLSESGGTYTAVITMTGTEPEGILTYTIDFKDRAGNPGIQVTETTDGSYVNHDVFPPEMEAVFIRSSNTDSTWAKVDDIVSVIFTGSEVLDNINVTIA